jgi:hypothetical protein
MPLLLLLTTFISTGLGMKRLRTLGQISGICRLHVCYLIFRVCENIKLSSGFAEAFAKLEKLFEYFGDLSVVVRPDVEKAIRNFFIGSKEVEINATSLAKR